MAGEATSTAGETTSSIPHISISIILGPLSMQYNGPPEFLDKLPGIIAQLQEFETVLRPPPPTPTAPPPPPQ